MNTHFKSALDQIKADEALVSKTEIYLRDTLAKKQNPQRPELKKWRMMDMKKFAIAACAALLLIGGGGVAYATPVSYMSLDINPSVELGVNVFGQVVSAEGYNEDGKTVLSEIKVTGTNVTEAVNTVIDSAAEKGFIAEDGTTVVSLTAETDKDSTAAKLNEDAEAGVEEALVENGKSAEVRKDQVALARRDEARELGISPGKLNLIQKLQAVDPTVTVDQYKDAAVKDIMKAIKGNKDNPAKNDKKDETVDQNDSNTLNNKEKVPAGNQDKGAVENTNKGSANSKANTDKNEKGAAGNKSTENGNK